MAEQRELILKLGQKITDRIGHTVTVDDPEYWGLAGVVTDEMAEVALSMKVRVPATAEEISKKCGKSLERTEELLKEMSVIGLIEYNWENAKHEKQYILPMFVPGCRVHGYEYKTGRGASGNCRFLRADGTSST